MPCDSITTVSLNTSNMDINVMKRTLERLGYKVDVYGDMLSGSWGKLYMSNGKLSSNTLSGTTVIREYTAQTVMEMGEEYGWSVDTTEEEYEYVLTKQ
jgi:hypothetical protein